MPDLNAFSLSTFHLGLSSEIDSNTIHLTVYSFLLCLIDYSWKIELVHVICTLYIK